MTNQLKQNGAMIMAKKRKMDSYCVSDAVSNGLSTIEELRDELQDWFDNMPESTQGGSKGDTLQSSIDALGYYDQVSVPESVENGVDEEELVEGSDVEREVADGNTSSTKGYVGHLRFEIPDMTKRRMSRAMRRDQAVAQLQGALDRIREELEQYEEGSDADPFAETRGDIETFCDELENAIGEFEGAEFPGMYG